MPFGEFCQRVGISGKEKDQRRLLLGYSLMPFQVTEHYTRLIESYNDPYRSQLINVVLPTVADSPRKGRFDPYGNVTARVNVPFLQHKYEKTLLVHAQDACMGNCQGCYKVREIRVDGTTTALTSSQIQEAWQYLTDHTEIDNVLVTGGDPAAIATDKLIYIMTALLEPQNVSIVRFATKGLAFNPQRFQDDKLLKFFEDVNYSSGKRIKIIAHYSHPAEIDGESKKSLRALQSAGSQIYGQPVIWRGVNDDVDVFTKLQNLFAENDIQSYYLVSCMPVKGAEQYMMPLEKAYLIIAESKQRLNGLAKKGVFVAPHDYGKLEITGFLPNGEKPEKIVLKWHEVAMPQYLPVAFKHTKPEDLLVLDFEPNAMYCFDDVLRYNKLPYIE